MLPKFRSFVRPIIRSFVRSFIVPIHRSFIVTIHRSAFVHTTIHHYYSLLLFTIVTNHCYYLSTIFTIVTIRRFYSPHYSSSLLFIDDIYGTFFVVTIYRYYSSLLFINHSIPPDFNYSSIMLSSPPKTSQTHILVKRTLVTVISFQ
jgi:hypothetical protein